MTIELCMDDHEWWHLRMFLVLPGGILYMYICSFVELMMSSWDMQNRDCFYQIEKEWELVHESDNKFLSQNRSYVK